MTTTHNKLGTTTILFGLAAATLALGGCADSELQDSNPFLVGQWRQMTPQEENHVEFVTLDHVVAYAPTAIRPGDGEMSRLLNFVEQAEVTSQDDIQIDASRTDLGGHDAVSTARLEILEGEFLQLGLPVTIALTPLAKTKGGSDQISVVVNRAVAVPPDCTVAQPEIAQRPDWKPGCTNTAALGLMIADPRDLVKGRPLAPADAEPAARAVEVYRDPSEGDGEGQNQELTTELTTGGEE